jgi:eukaryotic-like serine/threonine-protein kinase
MSLPTEPTVLARPVAGAGAGLDTYAGPSFVQERLRLLGKTVFLLAFGFYVVINGLYIASGADPALLTAQHNVMHLLSALIMAALWALARARPWPMRVLGVFDAVSILLAGVGLAGMAAMPVPDPLTAAILAMTVTLMARAVLVPSTAKRTLMLSTVAALPVIAVAVVFHQAQALPGGPSIVKVVPAVTTTLWMVLAVALSTVASHTVYGLRQQIREVSEIGQYTLEEKIGSGGMGEVWRARHRMLIRPAAVKLIRPGAIGTGAAERHLMLRRFEREAHATAGLRSPHTVQLYDFGVTDDGTLYYVMELLDGIDLDTLISRFGPMPAERAIHLLGQVCASLEDAHQNGLVHRDIKPANIVVSRSRAAWDFVKVLDFGLVKLEGTHRSDPSIKLTADGGASGTPGFMAPEIALGHDRTDHRVDLYAVGCLAYWLVTGKLVFEGPTSVVVMLAHAQTPPPPPSTRTELAIPPALEALILECLDKDPDQRPASAESIQTRLQAIPVAAPWTRERAETWWSEHAPGASAARPVADVLLSQEARPVRVIRRARPT